MQVLKERAVSERINLGNTRHN